MPICVQKVYGRCPWKQYLWKGEGRGRSGKMMLSQQLSVPRGAWARMVLHSCPKLRPGGQTFVPPPQGPWEGFRGESASLLFPAVFHFLYEFCPEVGVLISWKQINIHPVFSPLKSALAGNWLHGWPQVLPAHGLADSGGQHPGLTHFLPPLSGPVPPRHLARTS